MLNIELVGELIEFLNDVKHSVNELEQGFAELCSNFDEEVVTTDMEDWETYTVADTLQVIRDEAGRLKHLFKNLRTMYEESGAEEEEAPFCIASSPLEEIERGLLEMFERLELGVKDLGDSDSETESEKEHDANCCIISDDETQTMEDELIETIHKNKLRRLTRNNLTETQENRIAFLETRSESEL
jgi:DNA-directed RNA polymerase beta' subunit